MTTNPTGYSGTPLAKKLGIKQAWRVYLHAAPSDYLELLAPLPPDVSFVQQLDTHIQLAHIFVTEKEELARLLKLLRENLALDAVLWVSWPKKASKIASTVQEDTIRELCLPLGWVDVKVCAVSAIWSGLKLVVRKELR